MIEKRYKKIKEIEKIMSSDKKLEEYISFLEEKTENVPDNLSENIMSKIDEHKLRTEAAHEKFSSILKIAACTIFALIMWHSMPKDIDFENLNESKLSKSIDELSINVNKIFMGDINIFKGGDK